MSNTFFISDTHFGHRNAWEKFTKDDGTPMRPFKSTYEMDQTMIDNWNKVVGDKDRVYHLGDFCIKRRSLPIFQALKGRICLVLGNHDPWKRSDYDKFAPNIDVFQGVKNFPALGWVCTHVPVHPHQLYSRWVANIHGHLHWRRVEKTGTDIVDERYFNVSVECVNYTPIELEELKKLVPFNTK